jgi:hypothetical protein
MFSWIKKMTTAPKSPEKSKGLIGKLKDKVDDNPEQKLDPTFIASVFTGTLATFGVQAAAKKHGAPASGGITKEQMQQLIDKAAQVAPSQTIRIEQQPIKIETNEKTN